MASSFSFSCAQPCIMARIIKSDTNETLTLAICAGGGECSDFMLFVYVNINLRDVYHIRNTYADFFVSFMMNDQ
jgi:hypothetical protein